MNNLKSKARRSPTFDLGLYGLIHASPEFREQLNKAIKEDIAKYNPPPKLSEGITAQIDEVNPYQTLTVEKLKATINEIFGDNQPRVDGICDENGDLLVEKDEFINYIRNTKV